jgi:hypothetical protein
MATETAFDARTHNGYITVVNPNTKGHRTFRIWTAKKGGLAGKRIVSLLTGPDRSRDWKGFGFAGDLGIRAWKRYQETEFAKFADILTFVEKGEAYGLEYKYAGHCRVCNRLLTNPVAIQMGIGPVCGAHNNAKGLIEA